jgi:PEP-CTERM motif
MRLRANCLALAITGLAAVSAVEAQIVNIDATHGFTYDTGGSDPAPVPGQHINPIGGPLLLTLDSGTYQLTNAAGQSGATFSAWSFNVNTASWAWAFLIYDAGTDKTLRYFEAGSLQTSAAAVAAQAAVQSFSQQLVLTERTTVGFTLRDYYVPDNAGGISVRVTAVSPIPEPGAAALMLAGLGAVGVLVRRRTQAAAR